ncbi:hypothetical protein TGAM01_v208480 [Trichoderma gamsii]|uniref:Uncharacterized protein n=1 Tax=Trichoderma gamsii TaxID=398673 RepID=A0A2P4ZE92_9HYPO|nr:hypothetical protein TGAM01_v208480 [Trichoderma gamsii]PON22591.1 hypothetical protein TGAM01_v208480 [Trichoderma gamsii]
MHFVIVERPDLGGATGLDTQGRSYAAKVTHSRSRRRRVLQYRQEKLRRQAKGVQPVQGLRQVQQSVDQPSPHNILSSARRDPFSASTFVAPINSYEAGLFDYFVHVVVPGGKSHCEHFTDNPIYRDGMRREFLPLVLTNIGLLSGALLATCQSLFIQSRNPVYEQLAIQYKVVCLGHMNHAIPCEANFIGDATVIQALLLASDDYAAGDRTTAQLHYNAALQIVQLRGGSQVLGLNGFLWKLIDIFPCCKDIQERARTEL